MPSIVRSGTVLRFLLLVAGLVIAGSARANPGSSEPLLRIEAGMHTTPIKSIDIDAAARFAVTSSDDKTARLWELPSGRLLRVFRPPIGPDNEGKLFAVAISPDGGTVATSGWTQIGGEKGHTVYLFDRASGRMTGRLQGAGNIVNRLAFSPDGRWLAASIGLDHGVRVWDWRANTPPLSDRSCANRAWGLAWSPDGRLASGCDDGVRILSVEPGRLQMLASAPAVVGGVPTELAFHPGGDRLAVAYKGLVRIDILDGRRLGLIHSADLTGATGTLTSVAFSQDGRTLAAAGVWSVGLRMQMRVWSEAGRGSYRDIPVSGSSIFQMRPHPQGGFVLATADPGWGVVGSDERWQPLGLPAKADLRRAGRADVLRLAGAGSQVEFGFHFRETTYRFDLATRQLVAGSLADGRGPDVQSLPVTDWLNTTKPMLRGQALKIGDHETARSLAIAPGGGSFVIGSEWSLRRFDAEGKPGWVVVAPTTTWGVNLPSDGQRAGKLMVAAYGDGTIRWHRMSDGRELLAFFPHSDRRRWVLWTPSGYYDASPGAEELVGWHVNRGPAQAADFFPAAQFRGRFHRPDVIDRILDTLDEGEALAQANLASNRRQDAPVSVAQTLPPVVEVLGDTVVRTDTMRLPVRVRGRSGGDAPLTGWRVRVNGQLVIDESVGPTAQPPAAGAAQGFERTLNIPLPRSDSEIQIMASNRFGASVPAVVRVVWTPAGQASGPGPAPAPAPAPSADFQIPPKLYVLAVGVGAYQNPAISRLDLAAKDARDFAAALQRQRGKLYRDVEVRLLTDAQATADSVIDGLDWLGRQVTQHDIGMVFIAGHGMNDPELGYTYLPVNADPDRLRRTTVPMEEFRKTLSRLPGKAVFFFDTCHSGNVLGPRARNAVNDVSRVINELASAENGVVVFSSSTGRQLSYEDAAWGNGAFTKALVEGLEGRADYQKSGRITHKMLDLWVSERVKELTRGRQSPVTQAPGGVPDFPVAIVR